MSDQQNPDTIVLIHGFWVTPRSWEHWKSRYEAKGFTVHTPAYPGFEVEVEALRADPTPIADLTIEAIVSHLEAFLDTLDTKPILMGHSAGGAFMQVVMDHGYGCAGVGLNSAPTEGVRVTPWTQLHSVFPVLKNPLNHHRAVGFDAEQWKYAFTNTYTDEESLAFYERYHIPASGRVLFDSVLANFKPGHQDAWVDFKNPNRAPLLFLSGSEDHIMPPAVQASNAKHYKGEGTITEHDTYDGRPHLMVAGAGWEEIADRALDWALANAAWTPCRHGRRLSDVDPHLHPHRRTDHADRGGGLADPHRSDVRRRRAGPTSSAGGPRRARPPARRSPPPRSARSTPCCSLTSTTPTTSTTPVAQLLPGADVVLTTAIGRARLGPNARGLDDWDTTTQLEAPGKPTITVTATPCRHGPPGSHPIVGDVIGFALDLGRASSTARCGSPATPCSTTACATSPNGSTSAPRSCTSAAFTSRSPARSSTR